MTLLMPDGKHQLVASFGVWTVLARRGRRWLVDSRHDTVRDAVARLLELAGSAVAVGPALDLLAATGGSP